MINRYTRTFKANGVRINTVECQIYYSLGGMNYFTGCIEPRGYYFAIQPYLVETNSYGFTSKQFTAFSGSKNCVLPCERQSKKRFETACGMMDDLIGEYLPAFLAKHGIELDGNEFTEKWDDSSVR